MEEDFYTTVAKRSTGDFRDRGSKFPSHLVPCTSFDQLDEHIKALKKEHPSARHFCFGCIIGEDKLTKSSDDGEPSGTAGLPILNQLQSAGLRDVALIVVRYFGGTKLGKPGLINAYKEGAKDAIQNAKLVKRLISETVEIEFDYDDTGEVMKTVERIAHHRIVEQTFTQTCSLILSIPRSALSEVLHLFDHSSSIHITPLDKSVSDL